MIYDFTIEAVHTLDASGRTIRNVRGFVDARDQQDIDEFMRDRIPTLPPGFVRKSLQCTREIFRPRFSFEILEAEIAA